MVYNKEEIFELAKSSIVEKNLFFIEDVIAYMPCGRSWFYENFKKDTDEMDTIRELLDVNKVKTKANIRAKLYKSNKASELLALYRLLATKDEHMRLNTNYTDNEMSDNKSINLIDFSE